MSISGNMNRRTEPTEAIKAREIKTLNMIIQPGLFVD